MGTGGTLPESSEVPKVASPYRGVSDGPSHGPQKAGPTHGLTSRSQGLQEVMTDRPGVEGEGGPSWARRLPGVQPQLWGQPRVPPQDGMTAGWVTRECQDVGWEVDSAFAE